ncbi:MAG: DNA polymerase IV [Halioglobus sp.]
MNDSEAVAGVARKVIHVDMDAFFASVEQRDNPSLRGKPVAVGGSQRRGVVAAASYEARAFGVRSAMPSVTAARQCPGLIFVPARFDVYRRVSQQIRQVFAHYSDLVEPLSLDEAFLDVTADKQGLGSAQRTAEMIRRDIRQQTGLTASAGVSYNKFLAKIASDQNKPDGIYVIRPEQGLAFVAGLPVRRFFGVGPRTAERMAKLGIHTGAELAQHDLEFLHGHFGKSARYLFNAARGIDERPVRPNRVRKSVGRERTYGEDLSAEAELGAALDEIIASVWQRIEDNGVRGRTVTLKLKYANFRQITRSHSVPEVVGDREAFSRLAHSLLQTVLPVELGVRLLGVSLSGLVLASAAASPASSGPFSVQEQRSFDF